MTAKAGLHTTATRDELRLGRLADRVTDDGPVKIWASISQHGTDRVDLYLEDDSILELRLTQPERDALVALDSLRWDHRVGWVLVVRTACGERRVEHARMASMRTR
jgi:hypothetical protein